jgi:hypothetical protein
VVGLLLWGEVQFNGYAYMVPVTMQVFASGFTALSFSLLFRSLWMYCQKCRRMADEVAPYCVRFSTLM